MKKTILLLSFTVCCFSLFSQKILSWETRKELEIISVEAKKDEVEVRIYSSLPLTFQSITKAKDKNPNRPKVKKEGPLNVHSFLFLSLPTYSDRKLRISSKGYDFIEIPIQGAPYTITAYNVWDEELVGVTWFINEGIRLYAAGNYDRSKLMFLDAMVRLKPEEREREDYIIAHLDNIAACVDAKEKADKLFNEKKWLEAKKEYEKVIAVNPTDVLCKNRSVTCTNNHGSERRFITGKVTDSNGKAIEGLNIAPWEDRKPGLRTITDSSGTYQVMTVNKTTELVFWTDGTSYKRITITGDVLNFSTNNK